MEVKEKLKYKNGRVNPIGIFFLVCILYKEFAYCGNFFYIGVGVFGDTAEEEVVPFWFKTAHCYFGLYAEWQDVPCELRLYALVD